MIEREQTSFKAQAFFEDLWKRGDPWEFKTSEFERDKYARQFAILQGRRYARVLEIGCGNGCFTRLLAGIADRAVALDISPTAIAQARTAADGLRAIEFRTANIMDYNLHTEGPWDLIVMSETICYLGWLYSLFDVAWLASDLFRATCAGGRLLMANTCGGVEDYLLRPWIIRTYRDLFLNVGYHLEAEEIFHGTKNGADIEVLISLFAKAPVKDPPALEGLHEATIPWRALAWSRRLAESNRKDVGRNRAADCVIRPTRRNECPVSVSCWQTVAHLLATRKVAATGTVSCNTFSA